MMDLGLKGKSAYVMAASKGIGRACADALAAEGCQIALCARDEKTLMRAADEIKHKHKVNVFAQSCDVAQPKALETFVNAAKKEIGAADILIANAGGPPPGSAQACTDEQWEAAFNLTLMSVVRACRQVIPEMKTRKWGRIVAITSTSVAEPINDLVLSNCFRPAVAGFCKTLATELAPDNILVNWVLTGPFHTDRSRQLIKAASDRQGVSVEAVVSDISKNVPMRRMGNPLEIGEVVAFLASERCSFVTGTGVAVDGGVMKSL